RRLGRATAVSRVYIFKNYTDENNVIRMNQQWEWCATGVAAQIDNPDLHGLAYSEAGFDRWAEILADGQALYGDVEDFPEGERQMLEPQGIISIVVTPILVGERFYGFIGFDECSTPRKWTSVEVEALHGAGRALGLALARSDAENAVRRSEEQLDLALRGAALGTWNWHLDTNRVDFNEGWAEMLGYRLDEVESHVDTWKNALHPNDIAQTVGALRLHLEGESEKYESEHRLKTKSGDWIWVLDRGRIVERDSEGNAVRMAGTHLDITERKKMDAALTAAREKEKETESRIEETLLRGHVPRHIDGAETAALSAPSEHIDGDFYDFFQHGPHCFDILVGDVMGKGIQAALVGAGAKSHFLRALSALPRKNGSPRPASVHDIVAPVHSELAPQLLALERFITLIYARFDLDKKTLEFVDCGHMRTLHFHATDHSVSFIKGHNMPVGFVHSEEITTVTTRFGDGDLLLFYSDGVTEATDSEGNYFDEAHLQRYVEEHRHLSPNALIHALRGSVADFSGKTTFHDDFTCIAVRIGASPAKSREITIDSDLRELRGMRTFLRDLGGEIDSPYWNDEQTDLLLLSMQETLVNIIEHGLDKEAGHPIQIRAEWDTRHLTLSIIHEGRAFDPSQVLIPQIEAPLGGEISLRGRGLYIIRESTDSYTSGQINVRHACTTLVWHLHEDDINEKER
ncbi:MAG: SpoIIE family protein phosphatase, partial [Candidatus Sumerlaeota bacterium]